MVLDQGLGRGFLAHLYLAFFEIAPRIELPVPRLAIEIDGRVVRIAECQRLYSIKLAVYKFRLFCCWVDSYFGGF